MPEPGAAAETACSECAALKAENDRLRTERDNYLKLFHEADAELDQLDDQLTELCEAAEAFDQQLIEAEAEGEWNDDTTAAHDALRAVLTKLQPPSSLPRTVTRDS